MASRFASSLTSIGTPTEYTHASEWAHGSKSNHSPNICDFCHTHTHTFQQTINSVCLHSFGLGELGRVSNGLKDGRMVSKSDDVKADNGDIAIVFSHSGSGSDIIQAAHLLKERGVKVFAITSETSSQGSKVEVVKSPLIKLADCAITYAFSNDNIMLCGGVPTASLTVMDAISNAIVSQVPFENNIGFVLSLLYSYVFTCGAFQGGSKEKFYRGRFQEKSPWRCSWAVTSR